MKPGQIFSPGCNSMISSPDTKFVCATAVRPPDNTVKTKQIANQIIFKMHLIKCYVSLHRELSLHIADINFKFARLNDAFHLRIEQGQLIVGDGEIHCFFLSGRE